MSYQVAFCFWLLTFEQNVAEQLDQYALAQSFVLTGSFYVRKYDVIPVLVEVAKTAKEKVIRVIVAAFRVCIAHRFQYPFLSESFMTESCYKGTGSQPPCNACRAITALCSSSLATQILRRRYSRGCAIPEGGTYSPLPESHVSG